MSRLSKNFTLSELLISQTAARHGIDNYPTVPHQANLQRLAAGLLQPVRDLLGVPILISSGYRSETLNTKIKGSKTSAHSIGFAADFTAPSYGDPHQIVTALAHLLPKHGIKFDQLILEFYNPKTGQGWVHIGLYNRAMQQRNQVLTAKRRADGSTEYLEGVVL